MSEICPYCDFENEEEEEEGNDYYDYPFDVTCQNCGKNVNDNVYIGMSIELGSEEAINAKWLYEILNAPCTHFGAEEIFNGRFKNFNPNIGEIGDEISFDSAPRFVTREGYIIK